MTDKPLSDTDKKVHGSSSKSVNRTLKILERLKLVAKATTDAQLAAFLEINYQGVSQARRKLMIPPAWLLLASEKAEVSLDWLYYGKGSKYSPYFPDDETDVEEIISDIISRVIFKNKIYIIEDKFDEGIIPSFADLVLCHFDSFLEIITDADGMKFSYFLFGYVNDDYDYFLILDKKFYHNGNKERVDINKIRESFRFYNNSLKQFYTDNSRLTNIFKYYYQSQDLESMRKFFLQEGDTYVTPVQHLQESLPIKQADGQLQMEMDHTVRTLKDLGADEKTIQQAVIKLIERGK